MREFDPLEIGEKTTWSIYGTKALKLELERMATDAGQKLAPFMSALLIDAVRRRETEKKRKK